MTYTYTGDMNIEYGGMWVDLSTFSEGWVSVIKVTPLNGAIGWEGAYMIEKGTIPLQAKNRESALSCCSYTEEDVKDNPILVVEAFDAYGGVEVDYGVSTIQTLKDGEMSFDNWEANELVETDNLRQWFIDRYNIKEVE